MSLEFYLKSLDEMTNELQKRINRAETFFN